MSTPNPPSKKLSHEVRDFLTMLGMAVLATVTFVVVFQVVSGWLTS